MHLTKISFCLIAVLLVCHCALAQSDTLTYNGYTYKIVQIGKQVWFAENLRTEKYSNGDSIPDLKEDDDWLRTKNGACCYYNNDSRNENPYGKLYNWFTVADTRNVCPAGWHVSSGTDWDILIKFLDPSADLSANIQSRSAGDLLKTSGPKYWGEENNSSNSTGFSAVPGGNRDNTGFFFVLRTGSYWTSAEGVYYDASVRNMDSYPDVSQFPAGKAWGYSIRCIKN